VFDDRIPRVMLGWQLNAHTQLVSVVSILAACLSDSPKIYLG
jgi:hypothetical protein